MAQEFVWPLAFLHDTAVPDFYRQPMIRIGWRRYSLCRPECPGMAPAMIIFRMNVLVGRRRFPLLAA